MKLSKRKILDEMYAVEQIMVTLGFKPEDVYVSPEILDPNGDPCVGVVLRTQGIEFSVHLGSPDDGTEHLEFLEKDWPIYCAEMEVLSDTNRQKWLYRRDKTYSWKQKSGLLSAMMEKGLKFPYEFEKTN